jgi:hypothetical protein
MICTVIEVEKGMLFWLLWQGVLSCQLYTVKSFLIFPSLGGNYYVIYQLFLPRESLVSDILAGDGNIEKLFLWCSVNYSSCSAI